MASRPHKFLNISHRASFLIFSWGSFIAIALNILTLKDGHNWGEDFSQYILSATNLLQGKPYASGIMFESPFSYPPGFSILLMPFLKIFGVNFPILKSLNILFWFAGIVCWYIMFRQRLGEGWAVLGGILLAFSSHFFTFKQNIVSDTPFFFFASACLLFFSNYEKSENAADQRKWLVGALCFMAFAFLIRSIGLSLFLAVFFYLFFIKKDLKGGSMAIPFLAGALFADVVSRGVNPGFFNVVASDPAQFLHLVFQNMSLVLRCILWVILPPQTGLTEIIFKFLERLLIWTAPVIYLAALIIFLKGTFQKKVSFSGCFIFFYVFMFVFWSGFGDTVAMAARMALILTGPLIIFLIESVQWLARFADGSSRRSGKIQNQRISINFFPGSLAAVFVLIFIINIFNITVLFNFDDDVLLKKENKELFAWVKQNVAEEERYMFWAPRTMALMTGRVGAALWTRDPETQKNFFVRIKKLSIGYLILIKPTDHPLVAVLQSNPHLASPAWENEYYIVFKTHLPSEDEKAIH